MVSLHTFVCPNYATVTAPLRTLTHQGAERRWGPDTIDSFTKLKGILTDSKRMVYFDIREQTNIIVDASPVGLGAMLCQDGKSSLLSKSYSVRC